MISSFTYPVLFDISGGGGRKRPQSNVSGREEVLMLDPQPGISALATISPSHGGGGVSSGVGKPGDFVRPPSDFEPEEVSEDWISSIMYTSSAQSIVLANV